MIHFAKYLPAEGKITIGGKYWNKQHHTADEVANEIHLAVLNSGDFQPAKLFLCSRDVQVNDELTVFDGANILYKGQMIDSEGRHYTLKGEYGIRDAIKAGCFKVIGEISPEATWVKEGDEFEEEHVRFFYAVPYKSHSRAHVSDEIYLLGTQKVTDEELKEIFDYYINEQENYGILEMVYEHKDIFIKYVKVKGPCGHFH